MIAYTYGVFDLFHIGHLNLFKKIKQNYNQLIVGVHNDEQVMTYKDKPIISYEERLEIVRSCRYVDHIYENADLIITDIILDKLGADVVIAGNENIDYLKKYYQVSSKRLILFDRTKDISTSRLKLMLMS